VHVLPLQMLGGRPQPPGSPLYEEAEPVGNGRRTIRTETTTCLEERTRRCGPTLGWTNGTVTRHVWTNSLLTQPGLGGFAAKPLARNEVA
jgi:hypothetical protein